MENSNYVYFVITKGKTLTFSFQRKLSKLAGLDKLAPNEEVNFTPWITTSWCKYNLLPDDGNITLFTDTFFIEILHSEKVYLCDRVSRNTAGEITDMNVIKTFELEDIMKEYQKKLDLNLNYEILCLNIMPPHDFFDFKL